jgi:anthranilate phosphoribosyltransferase
MKQPRDIVHGFFYERYKVNRKEVGMDMKQAIQTVIDTKDLTEENAYTVAMNVMEGGATDAQISALLVALRLKGETIDEITGFVRAMREKATPIPCSRENLVDTCGTGGDRSGTFNVSTLSGLVAAAAGCNVAKHGNRSVSSQCGSADLLKELGFNLDISAEQVARCIDEQGFGFLFAPMLHKAMKYAIGPRREIGVRTIFNILGPMTNPAKAKRQLLGVFDGSLTEPLCNVLQRLGSDHVMVVHGEDGLDEITLSDKTKVTELKDGQVQTYHIDPEQFGLQKAPVEDIQGGDPAQNKKIALAILQGEKGAPRDMVLLNTGAVMYVGGQAESIEAGIQKTAEVIDSGTALKKLDELVKATNS